MTDQGDPPSDDSFLVADGTLQEVNFYSSGTRGSIPVIERNFVPPGDLTKYEVNPGRTPVGRTFEESEELSEESEEDHFEESEEDHFEESEEDHFEESGEDHTEESAKLPEKSEDIEDKSEDLEEKYKANPGKTNDEGPKSATSGGASK